MTIKLCSQKLARVLMLCLFFLMQQFFAGADNSSLVSGGQLFFGQQNLVKKLVMQSQSDQSGFIDLWQDASMPAASEAQTQIVQPDQAPVVQQQSVSADQSVNVTQPVQAPAVQAQETVIPDQATVTVWQTATDPVQVPATQPAPIATTVPTAPAQSVSVAVQTQAQPAKKTTKKTVKRVVKRIVRKKTKSEQQLHHVQLELKKAQEQVQRLEQGKALPQVLAQAKLALQKSQELLQAWQKRVAQEKEMRQSVKTKNGKSGVSQWKTIPKKVEKTAKPEKKQPRVISRFKTTAKRKDKVIANPGVNIKQQTDPLVPTNVPTQVKNPGSIPTDSSF